MGMSREEKLKRDRDAKRERYNSDPEYRKQQNQRSKENNTAKKLENKLKAIAYTGGIRCHNPKCVYIKHDEPLELCQVDFHHVLSQNKTRTFSDLFRGSWKKLKEEIDNCAAIPLCSNCHMLEEWGTDEERYRHILD